MPWDTDIFKVLIHFFICRAECFLSIWSLFETVHFLIHWKAVSRIVRIPAACRFCLMQEALYYVSLFFHKLYIVPHSLFFVLVYYKNMLIVCKYKRVMNSTCRMWHWQIEYNLVLITAKICANDHVPYIRKIFKKLFNPNVFMTLKLTSRNYED